ncbi:Stk1 family PASTA domain-containing Ser/Thr kinase [Microbacterium paludicola]|uniref:non-specific serine/threonine protein kinase n=1 Tax=Microbacterium paludicola TaxID=300019 RepID=A0A4Y9FXM2_9MICO|nr:Stk1 family PASTA domain-containing Ser/Thr kinase [Microbacterium paludicola]MBF0815296.1 Stk1 family PASTA domain-containing Ser/Thr kinase [Microbacterium paludicola]TFU34159.1 Stk1 family PASTA domain-containing Ser/Thr kinase [Microbacterium paludicola]
MSTSQQVDPLIGRLVDGRYRVRARIARGGMATVYVATDLRLERRVALKVMHGHLSDDSVFQSRFIQEARSAARLADPHVVNVFDQGQDGELAYLVMEYLPGITLRELLKEQRRLTVTQTITIMDAVLSGLAAAHRAGLIHRDVKPENVLLAEDGRIKIGDFGLARASSANTATGAQLLGTIAYLAPELVTRGTADARSDIYALGILLYEMLAGEQPYKGEQPMQIAFQHATDSVPRPSVKNPGVPEQLDELVLWATEKDPDERPSDAQEMLERLREIERELGIAPLPTRSSPAFETRALPADGGGAGATKVLAGVLPTTADLTGDVSDTGPTEPDNASRLRRRTDERRRRGAILLALVLVLAALAGAAGWWFGSGPGSQVPVPEVAGLTFAEAQQRLEDAQLTAVETRDTSPTVEAGRAIGTDPEVGTRLDKGEEVSVVISTGPAEVTLGSFEGMPLSDAQAVLDENYIAYDDAENLLVYSDAPADQVIGLDILPAASEERVDCFTGCTAFQGDTADLIVSLGPLPDVTGKPLAEAQQTLGEADLDVTVAEEFTAEVAAGTIIRVEPRAEEGNWRPGDSITIVNSLGALPDVTGRPIGEAQQTLTDAGLAPNVVDEYSDSVGADTVIRVEPRAEGGNWRPGDAITIVRSLGPQLFPVPDVAGMLRDDAVAAIEAAGFDAAYGDIWSVAPMATATGTDPAAGQTVPAGTRVYIQLTLTG